MLYDFNVLRFSDKDVSPKELKLLYVKAQANDKYDFFEIRHVCMQMKYCFD